MFKFLVQQ